MLKKTIINATFVKNMILSMRNIYKTLSVAFAAFALFSCGSKVEKQGNDLLDRAKVCYENGEYNKARMLIDSIKIVSPKAYKSLREAELLRREVMVKEKERDVAFFEEEVNRLIAVRDSLAAKLVFEKDKRFQNKGFYSVKSQSMSQNTKNNFIRASVHEDGAMYLTSFYRGKSLKHNTVTLSSGGTFVSCDKTFMERNYKDYGVNNERRDYKYGEDNGLVDFIVASDGKIEVELSGGKDKKTYTMREADIAAVRSVFALSRAIIAVKEAEKMLDEARFSLDFLKRCEERSSGVKQ